MSTTTAPATRTPLWVGAALLLVAVNLRLPIAAVPPVVDEIRDGLAISSAAVGAITTLPVLCFAVAAPLAPALGRRFGDEPVILACLVLLAGGVAVRLVPEVLPFYAGTLLLGLGIALANVLIPAVIKRWYPRPGLVTGLYVTVMAIGAAAAAALTVPLDEALGGWTWALAVWGVPSVLAAVAWMPTILRRRTVPGPRPPTLALRRDRTAWAITVLMGAQSLLFYASLAWIPEILADSGLDEGAAGVMLSLAMIFGVPTSLAMPVIAGRRDDQRALVAIAVGLWLVGLAGLLLSPGTATALWMVLLGLGQGAGFSLAMVLVVLRAPDGVHAAALAGMSQSLGYALAAVGPFAVGLVHDATGAWDASIVLLAGVTVVMLVAGLQAGRRGGMVGRP